MLILFIIVSLPQVCSNNNTPYYKNNDDDVQFINTYFIIIGLKPEYSPHLDAQGGKKAFEIKDPSGNQICFFSAH